MVRHSPFVASSKFRSVGSRTLTSDDDTLLLPKSGRSDLSNAGDVVGDSGYDPLRDSPLRYLGYSNECGEAFSPFVPPAVVALSYGVAICYVLVDTFDKREKAVAAAKRRFTSNDLGSLSPEQEQVVALRAAHKAIDTLVWQLLACMLIPGVIIHKLVHWTSDIFSLHDSCPLVQLLGKDFLATSMVQPEVVSAVLGALPTFLGLAVIPLICHPIDHGVDLLLDATIRPGLKSYFTLKEAQLLSSSRRATARATAKL